MSPKIVIRGGTREGTVSSWTHRETWKKDLTSDELRLETRSFTSRNDNNGVRFLAASDPSPQRGQRQPDAYAADKQDRGGSLQEKDRLPATVEEGAQGGKQIGHRIETSNRRHPPGQRL